MHSLRERIGDVAEEVVGIGLDGMLSLSWMAVEEEKEEEAVMPMLLFESMFA